MQWKEPQQGDLLSYFGLASEQSVLPNAEHLTNCDAKIYMAALTGPGAILRAFLTRSGLWATVRITICSSWGGIGHILCSSRYPLSLRLTLLVAHGR